jgi:hypothetical protein
MLSQKVPAIPFGLAEAVQQAGQSTICRVTRVTAANVYCHQKDRSGTGSHSFACLGRTFIWVWQNLYFFTPPIGKCLNCAFL